ncbi:membrane integrity-associated transporter subunit PqiC [Falsihalocynthiibacter sp. S25ZX9]|uniref:PqiC family protein n=1 Tax=Falsihalocynthiibacter sp. S25ZX9 TaxID=3240870 RepID=UPI0035103F66
MSFFRTSLAITALTLAACSGPADRYSVAPPAVTETIRIGFRSIEVREISLPTYAAADEIALQDASGKLVTESGALWADSPERAVAMELSRALSKLTGARVASSPWPLEAFPDARLEVRFESLIARGDGQYHAAGQYFVGVSDGGRERSGLFELAVSFDPNGGPQAIALARGQLILDLAKYIARSGLS